MSFAPQVWIQIVTWNNVEDLIATLNNLNSIDYPKDCLDLLVFDNGSSDGTAERVQGSFHNMSRNGWADLQFRRSEKNLGAFGGRTEALKYLPESTQYILTLDDDVELAPDTIKVLLEALRETNAGAVGARIVYFHDPTLVAIGAGYFNRWLGTLSSKTPSRRVECDFVPGGGSLFDRTIFEAVEGFDPEFYTSHGDVDIGLKVQEAGYKVIYEPNAVIKHKVPKGGTRTPERTYYLFRNKILLFRKHLSLSKRIPVYLLYSIVWIPKIIISSLIFNRGINRHEMRAILYGVLDALLDHRGKARVTF